MAFELWYRATQFVVSGRLYLLRIGRKMPPRYSGPLLKGSLEVTRHLVNPEIYDSTVTPRFLPYALSPFVSSPIVQSTAVFGYILFIGRSTPAPACHGHPSALAMNPEVTAPMSKENLPDDAPATDYRYPTETRFLDCDYDGACFCITQAFFPDSKAWERLSKALDKVVDPDRFAAFSGTTSLPFPAGKHKRRRQSHRPARQRSAPGGSARGQPGVLACVVAPRSAVALCVASFTNSKYLCGSGNIGLEVSPMGVSTEKEMPGDVEAALMAAGYTPQRF